MNIKKVNDKFVKGREGLTEVDLCRLLNLYEGLIEDTKSLDSAFSLFKKELWRRYEVLLSFERERKNP